MVYDLLPEVKVARLEKLFIREKPFYPRWGGWNLQLIARALQPRELCGRLNFTAWHAESRFQRK